MTKSTLPLAVHWATHVMNGWASIDEVPEEYREQVSKLCYLDLLKPPMPIVNHVFSYAERGSVIADWYGYDDNAGKD